MSVETRKAIFRRLFDEVFNLENGKVVEAWAEADVSPILERLNEALSRERPDHRREDNPK